MDMLVRWGQGDDTKETSVPDNLTSQQWPSTDATMTINIKIHHQTLLHKLTIW
jgi:hypothetical protein